MEAANKDQAAQDQIYNEARSNVAQFLPELKDRIVFMREYRCGGAQGEEVPHIDGMTQLTAHDHACASTRT